MPGKGPLTVLVDEKLVKQALLNILLNAAEALDKEEKKIEVCTKKEEGGVSVSVEDNGCGIGREERGEIFSLFYTTKSRGSGVGLPMVRKIMDVHHGKVRVKGRKGSGTKFSLQFLPARKFRDIIDGAPGERFLPEVVR